MNSEPVIAIVGATGLVGNEMLTILEERRVRCSELRLLASKNSEGEVYKFHDEEIQVEVLGDDSFAGVDIVLGATSSELAKGYVPTAIEAGAVVIDNSSQFRMDAKVPLVVPEVNFDDVPDGCKLIANPNCSTIQLAPILAVAHRAATLERVVVSTYQSVSGAGKDALDELWAQSLAVFNQQELPHETFQHQIAFNCIPQIDMMLDSGFTKEETKIINESRKILGLPNLRITSTAVRVPVFYSHAESVNIETKSALEPMTFIELLKAMPGIRAYEDILDYPLQIDVAGNDDIHVGRIRKDESVPHGIACWIVADNVRKGAALNAVQIVERLIAERH